jgi:hypothetical protein
MNFNKDNVALLIIILSAIIFFIFIMPIVDNCYYNNIQENFNVLNNNVLNNSVLNNNVLNNNVLNNSVLNNSVLNNNTSDNNLVKIDTNKCSRSCCGLSQWPIPSEMLDNTIPPEELKNYIPSNFSCNRGDNSGCVCVTQNDYDYLNNHSNNSHISTM